LTRVTTEIPDHPQQPIPPECTVGILGNEIAVGTPLKPDILIQDIVDGQPKFSRLFLEELFGYKRIPQNYIPVFAKYICFLPPLVSGCGVEFKIFQEENGSTDSCVGSPEFGNHIRS
jgi:hypothetical protein